MSENGSSAQDTAEEDLSQFEELPVEDAFVRMGEIVDDLQQHPDPEVRRKVFDLLDWVEAFHREAVLRVVGMLPGDLIESLRQDPVIAQLFDTYLEEEESEDLSAVLEEALDEIRPYVHSHGGEMDVLEVDTATGVVKLRLMGSCHGCPSSSITLTQGVERILKDKWPGFRRLVVEGEEEGNGEEPKKLLQIQTLKRG